MDKPDKLNLRLLTVDETRFGEMRQLLDAVQPASAALALRVLRDAFPEVSLPDRLRAMTETRH